MDALLLALLLGLALDQGDRSQRLARDLGEGARAGTGAALWPVVLVVTLAAGVSAALGQLVALYLAGSAGLLFFALTLLFGAAGLLVPVRAGAARPDEAVHGRWSLLARLLAHRLGDRSAFLLVGIAGMTGAGWATALGGALGGLAALVPPLLAGRGYERAVPLRIMRPVLGGLLLMIGLGCALRALGLVG